MCSHASAHPPALRGQPCPRLGYHWMCASTLRLALNSIILLTEDALVVEDGADSLGLASVHTLSYDLLNRNSSCVRTVPLLVAVPVRNLCCIWLLRARASLHSIRFLNALFVLLFVSHCACKQRPGSLS